MVAKIILFMAILLMFCLAVYWITLPYYDDWRKEQEQTYRKQLERDQALVDDAEREYWE